MDENPIIAPYQEPKPTFTPSTFIPLTQITGDYPTTTAKPTWTPRGFRDSFAYDTSSKVSYRYDHKNNEWVTMGAQVFGGKCIGGTFTLPTGWTGSYGSGVFTYTHNLGTSTYAVVTTGIDMASNIIIFITCNANTMVLEFENSTTSVDVEQDHHFILIPIV